MPEFILQTLSMNIPGLACQDLIFLTFFHHLTDVCQNLNKSMISLIFKGSLKERLGRSGSRISYLIF